MHSSGSRLVEPPASQPLQGHLHPLHPRSAGWRNGGCAHGIREDEGEAWGGLWTAVGRPEFRRARERALSFCGPARGLRRRRSLFRDDALASRRTATLACGYRTAYHERRPLTSPSAQAHDFEMGGIVRGPLAHAISIADQDIISFPSSRCGFDSHCPLPIASESQDQPKIQLFSDRPRSSAS